METHKNSEDRQAVPPTSDLVFKYVFGGEHSTRYLRSLLSAIQEDVGYPAIAAVEIANHHAFVSGVLYYWAETGPRPGQDRAETRPRPGQDRAKTGPRPGQDRAKVQPRLGRYEQLAHPVELCKQFVLPGEDRRKPVETF